MICMLNIILSLTSCDSIPYTSHQSYVRIRYWNPNVRAQFSYRPKSFQVYLCLKYLKSNYTSITNSPLVSVDCIYNNVCANKCFRPKFRSYKPHDENLQKEKLEDAQPSFVEEEVKDLVEAGKEKVVLQDLDIASLAPRKPDWDLKRDVAKKLEKLERRTQKAIAELIWERLKQGNEENLGALVTMNENTPTDDD